MNPARVILADPPWPYSDFLPGATRGAGRNYELLSLEEIVRFPLPPLADDALLVLWRVAAMQQEALTVAAAWGFTVKAEIVWVKTRRCEAHRALPPPLGCSDCRDPAKLHFGMGRTVRNAHEVALLGVRGRASRLISDHAVRSVIFAPHRGHSVKPEETHVLVERLVPGGPYVELFARRPRVGWQCFGAELAQGATP